MRSTLRAKLFLIVGLALLGMVALVGIGTLFQARVERQLSSIHQQYLPKIRLRPQLESSFERLTSDFTAAGNAEDADLLVPAEQRRVQLLTLLTHATDALTVGQIAALQLAIDDYAGAAASLVRRVISGDGGESLGPQTEEMQAKRLRAATLMQAAVTIDETALEQAFATARSYQDDATMMRLLVGGGSLFLLLGLAFGIARTMARDLANLVSGFERFSRNELGEPIAVGEGELGDVARQANAMAAHLQRLDVERARTSWTKAGIAGLNDVLRGDQDPEALARKTIEYLARYTGAVVGALYHGSATGPYRRMGGFALAADAGPTTFALGEGLVGQAATQTQITIIDAPKDGLQLCSGVVASAPRTLVLVPIARGVVVTGVIELALTKPWADEANELMRSVQESIAIALEVARARAASRALLERTQRQAVELEEAGKRLEQKADELARASAYKSQFLASMSHELRTPLNAIIGFSELMYDGAIELDGEQTKEYIGDILTSGRHLLQLINDVLDLSKVEAGKLELYPERLELQKIVSEVLAVLRTAASKRHVDIVTDIDPQLGELVLDPSRLKQVLYNYLSNALKFTPEGGRITVRGMIESDTQVRIEVEDTGTGIAPEDLQKLFGEFQQTDEGAKQSGSTGLGLALTKKLVEVQGGSVGVASTLGVGSTFHAIYPRVTARGPAAAAAVPVVAVAARNGAPTVLVIEDEPADRERLVALLVKAGYAVESVSTGAAALERCRAKTFHAITLDLFLPDMSGLEVLQELRLGRNGHVPVIVVTVVAEPGAVAGFAIHDILQKPLDELALVTSLARAGVAAHDDSSIVLVVDDDPASLKVMSATLGQLGYLAVCEQDSARGLQVALEQPPAAIVLDLIMPGMTGFEVLDQLRKHPATREVPVIVWTSKDLDGGELAQLRASANAVVSKGHDGNARVVAELGMLVPVLATEEPAALTAVKGDDHGR